MAMKGKRKNEKTTKEDAIRIKFKDIKGIQELSVTLFFALIQNLVAFNLV